MAQGNARAASAPSGFTSADRRRLAGVLALLSSDQPGERDAAAKAATRLVQARGVSWHDVLTVQDAPPETRADAQRAGAQQDAAADLAVCHQHIAHLSAWQAEFVASLAQWHTPWSAAQRMKVRQIAGQLRARGFA